MSAAGAVDQLWSMFERGWTVFTDEVTEANRAYSIAFTSVRAAKNPRLGTPMDAELRLIEVLKAKLNTLHKNALPKHALYPRSFLVAPDPLPEPEPEPEPMPPPPRLPPKYAYASWRRGAAAARAREEAERRSEKLAAELFEQTRRPRTRSGKGALWCASPSRRCPPTCDMSLAAA